MKKINVPMIMAGLLMMLAGCEKFLDVKPDKKLATPTTLADLQAIMDVNAMFTAYPSSMDIASDDYYIKNSEWTTLGVDARNTYVWDPVTAIDYDWQALYKVVFNANIVLDEIDKVTASGLGDLERKQVEGTALFFRSYAFYHLLQVFSLPYDPAKSNDLPGIVLRLKGDITDKSVRSSMGQGYQQVISDLKKAVPLLPVVPLFKTRPSRPAAYAQIARTFLVMGDYPKAYAYADSCLQLAGDLMDYNTIIATASRPFNQFNQEVIFHSTTTGRGGVLNPSRALVDTMFYATYAGNDLRKNVFYRSNANGGLSFKGDYAGKNNASLFNGITTSEMYLIRAEAAVRTGNPQQAIQDVNSLAGKRYHKSTFIPFSSGISGSEVLELVLQERRKELAFRGGTRWTDLRRFRNKSLIRVLGDKTFTLAPSDPRYAWLIPSTVIELNKMVQNIR